jgi:hypothetical protein
MAQLSSTEVPRICEHELSRVEGQLDRDSGELHFVELCEACDGFLREIGHQPYRPHPAQFPARLTFSGTKACDRGATGPAGKAPLTASGHSV